MKPSSGSDCSTGACGCSTRGEVRWDRRDFLKALGLGTGALALRQLDAMAGPFTRSDFEKLVPADKKLQPEWVRSLTERGQRTVYSGLELEKIGMPIGGICAGQVYLGGDGRLWHWDIFNRRMPTGAEHYAAPMKADAPLEQGFALRIASGGQVQERALNRADWERVSFIGEYPIGYVDYRDPASPVSVRLEAFSPFIPLNAEDSSLPATVMEFTVKNEGGSQAEVELAGWLENAVCVHSAQTRPGSRRNRLVRREGALCLECSAAEATVQEPAPRPDRVFADFESDSYGKWAVSGTAFGAGPAAVSKVSSYQGDLGGKGGHVVNTHASAPGETVEARDSATGTLTSPPFSIERQFITFLIGGGAHPGKTCMNLLVENQVVLSATGQSDNHMRPMSRDVRRWTGKSAQLQIVDAETGGWGNVGVDDIVFSDRPREPLGPLAKEPDFGTLTLALLGSQPEDTGATALPTAAVPPGVFSSHAVSAEPATRPFGQKLLGSLTRKLKLALGASAKVTFVVAWHMPNLKMDPLPTGRYYARRFESALAVAGYVARELPRLSSQTRLWHDTWYDSTLPFWFLDRTFLNTSILATSTCYRFGDGRFYGWEGVGCCEGTCGHVWQYAHAVARLFPELERGTREKVDFGLALQPDGAIHFRGEFNNIPAIDAQAGSILRALREHQMSSDSAFLKQSWPGIRKAVEWLMAMAKDANGDGLIEGNQHNTLDTDWYGPVAWLSGLYLAALLATETMAKEVGDETFAAACRAIREVGQKKIVSELFDEEYFINRPDPKHLDAVNSGTGCEIDQVFGQSWAFQVGLPRVLPQKETLSALQSLWRYNFTPDVGPYREANKPGRWYAMPGEAGLLMCTFPRTDWDYAKAAGKSRDSWAAGYFNECMNGFEYQVAGHMLWEGMLTEGLAITRAVHDRYHAARRNPLNEVECGDHYARSMASYGVFLAACGFEYHGPRGHIGFAPRLTCSREAFRARDFKTAFTAAEGWGTYSQQQTALGHTSEIVVRQGKLRLNSIALQALAAVGNSAKVKLNNTPVTAKLAREGNRVVLSFEKRIELRAGQTLQIALGSDRP